MCGLKLWELGKALKAAAVTPCMGVWIETRDTLNMVFDRCVTPCMGVWIET